jgi:L-alanine-DL-glutamate epimerase-like enolase superfamily enzyme
VSVATGRALEALEVSARTIPTDEPESDGTLEWDSTTIVVVQAHAEGATGVGYTYTHDAAARLIEDKLAPLARRSDLDDLPALWEEVGRELRNIGRPGIGFMALSAVDIALWDLKARLLGAPLVDVLGAVRDEAAVYGSGGFTSHSLRASQLAAPRLGRAGHPAREDEARPRTGP